MSNLFKVFDAENFNENPVVLCNKDLTVIDEQSRGYIKIGKCLADYFQSEDILKIEKLMQEAYSAELLLPIFGVKPFRYASIKARMLFNEPIVIAGIFKSKEDYIRSVHYKADILDNFIISNTNIGTMFSHLQINNILHIYSDVSAHISEEAPAVIDMTKFIPVLINSTKAKFDFPKCSVSFDMVQNGCFLENITIESLLNIFIAMLYTAEYISDNGHIDISAVKSTSEISVSTFTSRLAHFLSGSCISSFISAMPGCTIQLLIMELTAARCGFDINCSISNDNIFKLTMTGSNDSLLTQFKYWDQFENFDQKLRDAYKIAAEDII